MKKSSEHFDTLETEARSSTAKDLDLKSSKELISLLHQEDLKAIQALCDAEDSIAAAVDLIVDAFNQGGRLIYLGAGTSGRLGVLDAAECPPTFGVSEDQVIAKIAGGPSAFIKAIEGAEDSEELGKQVLEEMNTSTADIICGITASGRTPFVLAALEKAKTLGAKTILISATKANRLADKGVELDVHISIASGPESVSGSTRMKAGLATKAVLHRLTTASMIRTGHVYDNLMVDVIPSNQKLVDRATRIITQLTNLERDSALDLLKHANNNPKLAIIMHHQNVDAKKGSELLKQSQGHLRPWLNK